MKKKLTFQHSLVWFRNDLRVTDNPALTSACQRSEKVSAVFFVTRKQWQTHHLSAHRESFTYQALASLEQSLAKLGIPLLIKECDWFSEIPAIIAEQLDSLSCQALYANAEYALNEKKRDDKIMAMCSAKNIHVSYSHGNVIIPPGEIVSLAKTPFKIFTPYKKAWLNRLKQFDRQPLPIPAAISNSRTPKNSKNNLLINQKINALEDQTADATTQEDKMLHRELVASESAAYKHLQAFIEDAIEKYNIDRDIPALSGTSLLSPYLTVGLISPRACLNAARMHNQGQLYDGQQGIDTWISELIWREFYTHLLAANSDISKHKALRPETERVPWRHCKKDFSAWSEGRTGYPLVDAAMHQLNTTGWMHNRLRMVTATFLTKYLLIDWRWGEQYFMENLIDGHFAANNGGWQWCASTGSDAAPYFRILSPIRQAERFDKEAIFIKNQLPQLKTVPAKIIHQPGHPELLAKGYPKPIVDLKEGKERCLNAFKFAFDK